MYWQAVEQQIEIALKTKTLQPLTTQSQSFLDNNIHFTVHLRVAKKIDKPHQSTQKSNPFLPHEEAMFVKDCPPSHKLLLNKFPVLKPHALLCSKEFVSQQSPLTESDFSAWLKHLNSPYDMGFYNAGPIAGASQGHRHMQLIRLAHSDTVAAIAKQLEDISFVRFGPLNLAMCTQYYQQALQQFGLNNSDIESGAYNLIINKDLFWLVPRKTAHIESIFANGLNFCGHFLVKDEAHLHWLTKHGFIAFLRGLCQDLHK